MQVQGAAIQSSMDVGNGSDHAQPLPAVPFCASTASTTASSLAVLPTAAASDSGQGLVQGSEIRLTSRNAPAAVPIAPLPRTMKKEELEKLGGHSIREFRKYLLTHWHCTNCKCVWHGIPTTSTLFHFEWHTIPKFIASFCVYSSLRAHGGVQLQPLSSFAGLPWCCPGFWACPVVHILLGQKIIECTLVSAMRGGSASGTRGFPPGYSYQTKRSQQAYSMRGSPWKAIRPLPS